jgi:hypothetical protein
VTARRVFHVKKVKYPETKKKLLEIIRNWQFGYEVSTEKYQLALLREHRI